jgi:exonuclease SbcD
MKIIHTSDIHLDASFANARMPNAFGIRRRQSLRDVFSEILQRAIDWPADAVLIAGDLFEHTLVTRDTISFLREQFARVSPIPIFVAPGNHDPFTPDSPYANEAWPVNVYLFDQPTWKAHALKQNRLTVHGFAFDGPDISENPFGTLEIPDDGRIHVAIGHGSEKGHQPPEKDAYAPFDAHDAAVDGLAYLALGHFHTTTPIKGDFNTTMYYAGAPEGHNFSESGLHYYLEVEIDEHDADNPGADPPQIRVTPMPSSRSVYTQHTLDCTPFTNTHQVVEAIRKFTNDTERKLITRITLTGMCPATIKSEIPTLYEAVAENFEALDIVDESTPAEDYEELADDKTSLGAFVQRMNDEIKDAPGDARRKVLVRARDIGLSAYYGRDLPIAGIDRSAS